MKKLVLIYSFFISYVYAFDMAIKVIHDGNDFVGQRLVYFLKSNIEKSPFMHIASKNEPSVIIYIQSMDLDDKNTGISSEYSIIWLLIGNGYPSYLGSNIGYCGTKRVKEVAEGLTADTYIIVKKMIDNYDDYLEKEKEKK
jgi:hypothetical protein